MNDNHLRPVGPVGTFRARTVRDAVALERDGETVYACRELDGSGGQIEVLFDDGLWMLADWSDVDRPVPRSG